ncbi:hypothetical protein H8959_012795 [Pygathrix nigripes]
MHGAISGSARLFQSSSVKNGKQKTQLPTARSQSRRRQNKGERPRGESGDPAPPPPAWPSRSAGPGEAQPPPACAGRPRGPGSGILRTCAPSGRRASPGQAPTLPSPRQPRAAAASLRRAERRMAPSTGSARPPPAASQWDAGSGEVPKGRRVAAPGL